MPKIQPPPPGPAPNTALLKSKILTLSESGPTVITLAVTEVIALGASTPVITQNDTLRVRAPSLPESIREGSEFTGLFIHRPVLNKFKDTSMAWQLTKIEQKDYK